MIHENWNFTLPKPNIFPKNQWLQDCFFLKLHLFLERVSLLKSKMYHLRPSYIWEGVLRTFWHIFPIQKADPQKKIFIRTNYLRTCLTTNSKLACSFQSKFNPHLAAPWGWNGPQVVRWTHASRHGWSVRTIFRDGWMMLGGGIKWMSFCSGFTLWVCSFVEFSWISIVDNYFFVPFCDWILP